ncbi:putative myristylated membrane protein [Lumpy skin disease virus]|uniref:Myristylated membrane protein n=1 Tax=Lumpy skin disease virus TaxID=59509 RepID=Q91MQ5_LSDV|nr:LSDV108 putative myristylated membrane protein [Lumpy skin disease virus NI-2490]AAN02676.1 putative myristylated membrane protein [Lumpy skin disease virus NW-LW]AOE47684.1 putative myristylated membrane protein [Lumpy skin disease virus]AAK85069.1 LSDV108 putative myristylated membrane protein [Lumpy skin disease virus NI-2490]ARO77416.1 putative myristylated membrane protein [Lumpy skin disease virus]ART89434.1 putative myristylated membrane protein [Lumpy skin disease virus]
MGGSVSVTNLNVSKDLADYNKKYMFINFNYPEYNKIITFLEEQKIYNDDKKSEILPNFCLTDNLKISHCGNFVSDEISKKYILVKGDSCRSFSFRPGSMILYTNDITEDYLDNKIPESAKEYILKGTQCKFIKKDYFINDDDIIKCCTNPSIGNCPKKLNNEYQTSHCDNSMSFFCKSNPDNVQCLKWLRTKRKIALSTYTDICSNNMDKRYCSEFIRVVRPNFFTFGDIALLSYCNKNKGNRNCWCVSPPNNITFDRYLGPRVCLLHECTDKTRDRKWLLYDQDIQRSRCKYIGCNININSLTLENSKIDLISDCSKNKNIIGDLDPGIPKAKKKRDLPNIIGFPFIFICLAVLFYFLVIYNRKKIKTNNINVRRR